LSIPRRRATSTLVLVALLIAGSVLSASPAAAAEPVRIMPLGDSITEGFAGAATYRYWLDGRLDAAGVAFDFVGSRTGVRDGAPRFPDFDQQHDGHAGWRADQLLAGKWDRAAEGRLADWAAAHRPDVVLLHVGTNDIRQCETPASTATEVGQIVAALRQANPDVDVVLARIIATTPDPARWCAAQTDARLRDYNGRLGTLASALTTERSRVVTVDQYTGFSVAADTYDGVHPDESGEQRMAEVWEAGVLGLLGGTAPPPPPATPTIALRGATTSAAGTGKVVDLATPAGSRPGDVLLASIAVEGNVDVAVPPGWSLLPGWPRATGAESWRVKQYVLLRTVAAGEPAVHRFTRTGTRHAATLLAYSGVDTTAPVDASGSQVTGWVNGKTPAITTTVPGAEVVALVSLRNGQQATTTVAPPAEMTERAEVGRAYVAAEAASVVRAQPGAVPASTFTFSQQAQGVLSAVALRPAAG
jgi:hypothetical protein